MKITKLDLHTDEDDTLTDDEEEQNSSSGIIKKKAAAADQHEEDTLTTTDDESLSHTSAPLSRYYTNFAGYGTFSYFNEDGTLKTDLRDDNEYNMWKGNDFDLHKVVYQINTGTSKGKLAALHLSDNFYKETARQEEEMRKRRHIYPIHHPILYFSDDRTYCSLIPDYSCCNSSLNHWKGKSAYDIPDRALGTCDMLLRAPYVETKKKFRQRTYWYETVLSIWREDLRNYYNSVICSKDPKDWTPFKKTFKGNLSKIAVYFSCFVRPGESTRLQIYDITIFLQNY